MYPFSYKIRHQLACFTLILFLRPLLHENHILIKLHIWFWSKLVITLAWVRAFSSLTNANTNSVRVGRRSFSENNFLQLRRPRLLDIWELGSQHPSHQPSCQILLSAVFVLNTSSASQCPLIFNFWLEQSGAKTSYWNIQVFLGLIIIVGFVCRGMIISDYQIIRWGSVHISLLPLIGPGPTRHRGSCSRAS